MIKLYIGSLSDHSGKSFVGMALGSILQKKGLKIGYMKPVGKDPVRVKGRTVDADVVMVAQVLGIGDEYAEMSPHVLDYETMSRAFRKKTDLLGDISVRVGKIRRDVLLIEGMANIFEGALVHANGIQTVGNINARAIIVEPWNGDRTIDLVLSAAGIFGKHFAGAVLNKVPPNDFDHVRKDVKGLFKRNGIPLFAALRKDPFLGSVTVRALKEILNGKVLCCEDHLDDRVENYLVGAMDVSNAIKYFRRTHNKAVITGGHRADIQLAALETSTKCLILTGGVYANDVIVGKAETTGVPIISVKLDTFTAIERIEAILGKTRVLDDPILRKVISAVRREFDWKILSQAVGLK